MKSHNIENEQVLQQSETSVVLEFVIPETSDFFDGHFPAFKLLPAVAQLELVTRFGKKYLNVPGVVSKIKRFKCSSIVLPETKLHLEINLKKEKSVLQFEITDAGNAEKTYSSGTFSF